MTPALTSGSIRKLFFSAPGQSGQDVQPVLQVLNVRPVEGQNGSARYKLLLSDGAYFWTGVLSTSLVFYIENLSIQKHSIIRVTDFNVTHINGRKVFIVTAVQPAKGPIPDGKIGQPRPIEPVTVNTQSARASTSSEPSSDGHYPPTAPLALPAMPPPQRPAPAPANRGGFSGNRGTFPLPVGRGAGQGAGAVGRGAGGAGGASPLPSAPAGGPGMRSGVFGGGGGGRGAGAGTGVGGAIAAGSPFGPRGGMAAGPQRGGGVQTRGGFMSARGGGGRGGGGMQAGQGGMHAPATGGVRAPNAQKNIHPIAALSGYSSAKWTIRARVTQKSDVKTWSNARGEGKLFSMTLMDESGEIKATAFGEMVDNWHSYIEEGRAYFVTGGKISPAKKNFTNVDHESEIGIEKQTDITLVEDDRDVPQVQFNFVPLSKLEELDKDTICDVIVVLTEIGEIGSITMKSNGKEVAKRELTVADRSEFSCKLSLWGKTAETFSVPNESVIALKSVKVGEFKGKTLSMTGSSSMLVHPDMNEAHSLRGWYDSLPANQVFKTHASTNMPASGFSNETITTGDVEARGLGRHEHKADYFNLSATIAQVRSDRVSYPAHGVNGCQKKVVEDGNQWRCDKCDAMVEQPEYRCIVSLLVLDHTGELWLSGFNDVGEKLFGMSAGELEQVLYENPDAAKTIADSCKGKKLTFRCAAKNSVYQDEEKVKVSIQAASEIDFAEESRKLIEKIRQYGIDC